ncbi:MAG: TetR/AcrR family transcriptional regulator [Acidimicrobiales bacterium]|nr:TetR/AcrR family transcriptional regulator [Acidimicrobiales bacterium]
MVDPRIARTRDTVLRAARDLLVEGGPAAVTVDAVVARSGVAKSTIYRHWESRDELLLSVMEGAAPFLHPPPASLDFESALRALVEQLQAVFFDDEWARMLPALLMLKHHEEGLAHLEGRMHEAQSRVLAEVLDRGVAEGRLPAGYDLDEAAAHLVGPMLLMVLADVAVDPSFGRRVVDRFLVAFGVAAPG